MAEWLSWPVVSRTFVGFLSSAFFGLALCVFAEGMLVDKEGIITLLIAAPCAAVGMALCWYRIFRQKTEDVTLPQKRACQIIAYIVVLPLNLMTLAMILLMFIAPFLFMFGWVDPNGRANLSQEMRIFGLWLTGAWFMAGYEFWFDALTLRQEIEMDEWALEHPEKAAELKALTNQTG